MSMQIFLNNKELRKQVIIQVEGTTILNLEVSEVSFIFVFPRNTHSA